MWYVVQCTVLYVCTYAYSLFVLFAVTENRHNSEKLPYITHEFEIFVYRHKSEKTYSHISEKIFISHISEKSVLVIQGKLYM